MRVTLYIVRPDVALAYALERLTPASCATAAISHDGEFGPANCIVRWGHFADYIKRSLTYELLNGFIIYGA